jgi:hypothetical protein
MWGPANATDAGRTLIRIIIDTRNLEATALEGGGHSMHKRYATLGLETLEISILGK